MPSTFNKRTVIVAVLVLIVVAFAAYQIGYGNGAGTKTASQTQSTTPVMESHLVLGTVEKISGQEITLKNFQKIPNIAASSTGQAAPMVVVVDQSTIIERLVQKDIATINREKAAFLDEMTKLQAQGALSSATPIAPPESFTREKLTLNDIKAGDTITAFADGDISKVTTFTAAKIDVQDAPPISAIIPNSQ